MDQAMINFRAAKAIVYISNKMITSMKVEIVETKT